MEFLRKLLRNPEDQLYTKFSDLGVYIEEAGKTCFELVDRKLDPEAYAKDIEQLEKQADVTVAGICTLVDDISIMKYNHRDVVELAKTGDSIIDFIWGAVDHLVNIYSLPLDPPELRGITETLFEMTKIVNTQLLAHIGDLRKLTSLPNIVKELKDRENVADASRKQAERNLFQSSKQNTQSLVEWRAWGEVYKRLEKATDRCVDVLDIVSHLYRERV